MVFGLENCPRNEWRLGHSPQLIGLPLFCWSFELIERMAAFQRKVTVSNAALNERMAKVARFLIAPGASLTCHFYANNRACVHIVEPVNTFNDTVRRSDHIPSLEGDLSPTRTSLN